MRQLLLRYLPFVIRDKKRGVVLGIRVVMYIGGELVIRDIFVSRSVFFLKDVVRIFCIFSVLYF